MSALALPGLWVDGFAGGGGASTGIGAALVRANLAIDLEQAPEALAA
jgi:hypothetical protein